MKKQPSEGQDSTIVFDVETQKSLAEVGGRENIRDLLLSLAVVYHYSDSSYVTFLEKDADSLLEEICRASRVIGFNLLGFDYIVLDRYGKLAAISQKTVDMMKLCEQQLGFRPKLDDLAYATLGKKKGANGLLAIRLFREGKIKELEQYCRNDVLITRELFEFGRKHGFVYIEQYGKKCKITARW
jgi:DEAD/DEAH box helicase domain-containing protein